MKKCFITIVLSIIFISLFLIPVYSANYTPYASVTSSTSNISMLIETMYNQEDYNPFLDWIGIRTGQYDYSVFYNIENGSCTRLRYYGISSGYNTEYTLTHTIESNFSYNTNGYTIVGNTQDSLGVSSYREYLHEIIMKFSVPSILIIFMYYVFKIRKTKRGISI